MRLGCLNALQAYAAKGSSSKPLDLRIVGAALAQPTTILLHSQAAAETPAAPALPPPKPYIHPELEALGHGFGVNGSLVSWAIQRMTVDFTLRDIGDLLRREGRALDPEKISNVLTRMKSRNEIVEIIRGSGKRASVYRNPASAEAAALAAASSDQEPSDRPELTPAA